MIIERLKWGGDKKLIDSTLKLLSEEFDYKNRGENYWINRFRTSSEFGFLALESDKPIGFLGTIKKNENIGLSVWYFNPSFRQYSINFLVNCLKKLEDNPIINSSPNPIALKIFKSLEGFKHKQEFVGIPKKLISLKKLGSFEVYRGARIHVTTDPQWSIFHSFIYMLKNGNICLKLGLKKSDFIYYKVVNVVFKNLEYKFPMSIYGDIFE